MSILTALQIAMPNDFWSLLWILVSLIVVSIIIIAIVGFPIFISNRIISGASSRALTGGLLGGGDLILTAVKFLVVAIISAIVCRV